MLEIQMWMGGVPPIGYTASARTLVPEPEGAALIQHVYARYLELDSVRALIQELETSERLTPRRMSSTQRWFGGQVFARGQLYRILSSPVYIGQIAHKDKVYAGQHPAIVDESVWQAVQEKLASNRQGHERLRHQPSKFLLSGLLFDEAGKRLIPSHSQKQTKRYRYYVSEDLHKQTREHASQGMRLPAEDLERLVISQLMEWLCGANGLLEVLQPSANAVQMVLAKALSLSDALDNTDTVHETLQALLQKVMVSANVLALTVKLEPLLINGDLDSASKPTPTHTLTIPIKVQRVGYAMRLIVSHGSTASSPRVNERLIRSISTAHEWLGRLTSGEIKSIAELEEKSNLTQGSGFATRMLYRAFLAPKIVRAVLDGTQPVTFTSDVLKRHLPLPFDWDEQCKLFGFE